MAKRYGWTEHYIYEELPLARAMQYRQCALRENGYWLVAPSPPAEEQWAAKLAAWQNAKGRP